MSSEPPTLLFDGVCNLCSKTVQFIVDHEEAPTIRFCSIQSEAGRALLERHGRLDVVAQADPDTMIFVEDGRAYDRSTGALKVARHLKAPWCWGRVALVLPRFLRDLGYRFIAKNRYRWFGKTESCLVPSKALRERFLG
jgi:predicted DCC family thiol-disulfide oxidoreductase YuxK